MCRKDLSDSEKDDEADNDSKDDEKARLWNFLVDFWKHVEPDLGQGRKYNPGNKFEFKFK
jgi:hypothetical protein